MGERLPFALPSQSFAGIGNLLPGWRVYDNPRNRFLPVPQLPDIVVYIEALEKRILGERLEQVRIVSPFLLRTAAPPIGEAEGKTVTRLRRLGKRNLHWAEW